MAAYKIVMIRHGESEWNLANKFTGWYDAKLSETGKKEALAGGLALKEAGYEFDIAHTSVLSRANDTLAMVQEQIGQPDLPVEKTWRLNERHYGGLTGLNKAETAEIHGEDQVKIWRRSFDIPPPPMPTDHAYYDNIRKDERYKPVVSMQFLGDEETVKKAIESVAAQGKAKKWKLAEETLGSIICPYVEEPCLIRTITLIIAVADSFLIVYPVNAFNLWNMG